jgi:DHA2 family multidrug resistance protein
LFPGAPVAIVTRKQDPNWRDASNLISATGVFCAARKLRAPSPGAGLRLIGQQVQMQASFLAHIDVYWTLMSITAAIVVLVLILRKVKLGSGAQVAH